MMMRRKGVMMMTIRMTVVIGEARERETDLLI